MFGELAGEGEDLGTGSPQQKWLVCLVNGRPEGVIGHARLYGRRTVRLRSPEASLDGGGDGEG